MVKTITLVSDENRAGEMQTEMHRQSGCTCKYGYANDCCNKTVSNSKDKFSFDRSSGLNLPLTMTSRSRDKKSCFGAMQPNAHICSFPARKHCPYSNTRKRDLEPIVSKVDFNQPGAWSRKETVGQKLKCEYTLEDSAHQTAIDDTLRNIDEDKAKEIHDRLLTAKDKRTFLKKWCFLPKTSDGDKSDDVMMYPYGPPLEYTDSVDSRGDRGYRVQMCSDFVAGNSQEAEDAVAEYCRGKPESLACACFRPANTIPGVGVCDAAREDDAAPWDVKYHNTNKAFTCGGKMKENFLSIGNKRCWFPYCNPEDPRGRHGLIPNSRGQPFGTAENGTCHVPDCLNIVDWEDVNASSVPVTQACGNVATPDETEEVIQEAIEEATEAEADPTDPESVLTVPDVEEDEAGNNDKPEQKGGSMSTTDMVTAAVILAIVLGTIGILVFMNRR